MRPECAEVRKAYRVSLARKAVKATDLTVMVGSWILRVMGSDGRGVNRQLR